MPLNIVIHKPHRTFTVKENDINEINEKVYEILTKNGINDEAAIDCASWCELACDNESYNTDLFDVYVEAD